MIAGELRGARIDAPDTDTTRPITDQVKETIFNILGVRLGTLGAIPPVEVLDLFAGSGSLGIEALSRGAARCTFVERDRGALRTLRENIERLRLADRSKLLAENAWTLRIPRPDCGGYGLIFADPPYRDAERAERVMDLLDRVGSRLTEGGLMVFRHASGTDFSSLEYRTIEGVDSRRYRDMHVHFFAPRAAARDLPSTESSGAKGSPAESSPKSAEE